MKLRNRAGFIIVLIMLAIAGFLLQDAFSSNNSFWRFGSNTIGSVNGTTVDHKEYQKRVERALENAGATDAETSWNVRDQVWYEYVNEILLKEKYEKLGIEVSGEELANEMKNNPHPQVRESFTNPQTGQFEPTRIGAYIDSLEKWDDPKRWNQWYNFKKYILNERLRAKYNSLVEKAMYIPSWQANETYTLNETKVDFEYVYLSYADVNDADVAVTDAELQDYINDHKAKYKRQESRAIEYITFELKPSAKDTADAGKYLTDLLQKFRDTNNDTAFVRVHSDTTFDTNYYEKDSLKTSMRDSLFAIAPDSVVIGPFYEDGVFKLAKVADRKLIPDSVKARQIFIKATPQDFNAKQELTDSILKLIKDGGDFALLAGKHSDDKTTSMIGGEWGWIKPDTKFKSVNDSLFFRHKKGDIFSVLSNDGFHVIEITEATPSKDAVQVAFVVREILPSNETQKTLFEKADSFATNNKTAESFREAAKQYNLREAEGIQRNSHTIGGLGLAPDLVRWVYKASVNDVSDVITLNNDTYVIALLASAQAEGVANLEGVRGEVEAEVKKQKKAKTLADKMTADDLNGIATATGKPVKTATGLTFKNTFISDVGNENSVVGKALGMNPGETAKGIVGENGVFAIKLTTKNAPPALTDFSAQKKQMAQNTQAQLDYMLLETIRKSANVKDKRYNLYNSPEE